MLFMIAKIVNIANVSSSNPITKLQFCAKKKTVSIPNKNKTTEITQMVHVFKKKMIHTL